MKKGHTLDLFFGRKRRLGKTYLDTQPPLDTSKPAGPFQVAEKVHAGDLLLFVPRNEISRTINNLTGKYGYSHAAVDCGEIDKPSGRRVMIEATVGAGVHYAFQDEYGQRPFVRLPLRDIGLDVDRFCECIRAHVGDKFDDLEAITLGILDNPARQICSDLVTVCLPEDMREQIAHYHRKAVIHPLAAARDQKPGPALRLFMSPNGFAEFLGAPLGQEVEGPDQLAEPHVQDDEEELSPKLWKWGDTLLMSVWKNVLSPVIRHREH